MKADKFLCMWLLLQRQISQQKLLKTWFHNISNIILNLKLKVLHIIEIFSYVWYMYHYVEIKSGRTKLSLPLLQCHITKAWLCISNIEILPSQQCSDLGLPHQAILVAVIEGLHYSVHCGSYFCRVGVPSVYNLWINQ